MLNGMDSTLQATFEAAENVGFAGSLGLQGLQGLQDVELVGVAVDADSIFDDE